MTVDVTLFAGAREAAGTDRVSLQLPEGARVRDLKQALGDQVPALVRLLPHLFIAINEKYAGDGEVIPESAEIACFPPVSGG